MKKEKNTHKCSTNTYKNLRQHTFKNKKSQEPAIYSVNVPCGNNKIIHAALLQLPCHRHTSKICPFGPVKVCFIFPRYLDFAVY